MAAYPGPWAFALPKQSIIFTTDLQLETLPTEPDKVLDLSLRKKCVDSLRQLCEEARRSGARTLVVAFVGSFQQYRDGQSEPRHLMPDTDAYIDKIARISKVADQYGLEMELSLLSPLEIGRGYRQATGESGAWMHYRKGLRDPVDGSFTPVYRARPPSSVMLLFGPAAVNHFRIAPISVSVTSHLSCSALMRAAYWFSAPRSSRAI